MLHVRLLHDAGLPDIELHWRVHWYEAEFGALALARAESGPDGVRRLRTEDDLAALMLYQARDGFAGLLQINGDFHISFLVIAFYRKLDSSKWI